MERGFLILEGLIGGCVERGPSDVSGSGLADAWGEGLADVRLR